MSYVRGESRDLHITHTHTERERERREEKEREKGGRDIDRLTD